MNGGAVNMVWRTQGRRWRCPVCRVIYWSERATCVGGDPIYDPQRPGARIPEHPVTAVEPDPQLVARTDR